jgi:hypothetical protein
MVSSLTDKALTGGRASKFKKRDFSFLNFEALTLFWPKIPFWEMTSADELIGNPKSDNSRYALAEAGEVYVVYLPTGGTGELDLGSASTAFDVKWFNPRKGGPLQQGSVKEVKGGGRVSLGQPPAEPAEDWCVLVRQK